MTIYALPAITPTRTVWGLESNTARYTSPLTGVTQTADRGGERWRAQLTFSNLTGDDKAELTAFLVKLNGQQHRFVLQDHGKTNRGAFGGTPLVAGADQTGTNLSIDGATPTVTNWARAGDMIGVDNALKMVIGAVSTDGAGATSLAIRPRIVTAPPDNEPIITVNPTGIFMLADNAISWGNEPGNLGNFIIEAIEDVAA